MKKNNKSTLVNTKRKKKGSIRGKLLLFIFPAVIAMVVILTGTATGLSSKRIRTMADEELESSISNQADNIEAWLNENLQNFQSIKTAVEGLDPSDEELQKLLNSYKDYNKNSPDGVRIGTSDGKVYRAEGTKENDKDPVNSNWFQQGTTSINMHYGAPYSMPGGSAMVISASGMIDDDSDVIKVMAADLRLDSIATIVNSGVKMDGASAFLVDTESGTILASPIASQIGEKISSLKSSSDLIAGINSKINKRDYQTATIAKNQVAFSKIGGVNWVLVSYIPNSVIFESLQRMTKVLLLIGILCGILIVVVIALVVSKVAAPLTGITNNIKSMSEGDFTIDVKANSNDEIGEMGRSVKDFIGRMREMISDINSESVKLKEQSDSSDHVSKQMFVNSRTQAEAMQKLNETVDQLAKAVNEIAQNATTLAMIVSDTKEKSGKAGDSMKVTVELSQQGRSDMQKLSYAMKDIEEANNDLVDSIDQVGTASEEITKIVSLISEIAEETNLLSLNASIEAARAGEAGKGFAVVASEIAKLANTSSESADNIAKLIDKVRTLIGQVVSKANDSAENIRNNTELINTAVSTFDDIFENIKASDQMITDMVSDVDKVNDVASNVAAISEEQAASADSILETSQTMVEKADSISKSSQDVADNSHELASTSDELAGYVNKFRI